MTEACPGEAPAETVGQGQGQTPEYTYIYIHIYNIYIYIYIYIYAAALSVEARMVVPLCTWGEVERRVPCTRAPGAQQGGPSQQ